MTDLQESPQNRPLHADAEGAFTAESFAEQYAVEKSTPARRMVPDRNSNGQYGAIVGCCPTCGGKLKNQQMRVDLDTNTFLIRGQCIYLRAKEAELLAVLVKRAGVIPHDTIVARLWGIDEPQYARCIIAIYVRRLRQALETVGATIESVYGVGYRFEAGEARHD